MHLSVFVSVFLALVSSLSTYAAPYGTPGTFLDIDQRSPAPLFEPLAERGQLLQPRADEHHVPAVPPQHQHSSVQPHSSTTHEHPGTENEASGPARPVYLTSRSFSGSSTSGRNRAVDSPGMFGHWAVVVGDHYYELVFNREVQNEASTSQSVQGQGIRLRVGNTPMAAGWHALQPQGMTTWTDEQIHAAAEQLITQMSARSYHILTNNCHDFANVLIRCITVGGQTRHCTVL
ncbi:hypothetical protein F5887DRAFT_978919 [Amanita rubescens]|nr:hypothetical protein F5887DRAFT_978919 [Amanita rubescens]